MVITNNILGMNAQRQFNIVGNKKKKSTEKLSSGFKINRAADDAAGLTISEKMRSQIRGLTQGVYNTQDGVSMCQVADGALEEVDDMLHRLTELAIKASNGTNTDQDRQAINQEKQEILREIDRISDSTEFNEKKIFGSGAKIEYKPLGISDISIPKYTIDYPSEITNVKQSNYKGIPIYPSDEDVANTPLSVWIQSGCKAGDGINLEFDAMNTSILGIDNIDLSTIEGARSAISDIEGALDKNNANRSKIGAQQNRLEHTIDNENNIVENITAAESRIRDTNMAKETANLAVQNILTQAGVAMMAQANQQNQGVLQLLQV